MLKMTLNIERLYTKEIVVYGRNEDEIMLRAENAAADLRVKDMGLEEHWDRCSDIETVGDVQLRGWTLVKSGATGDFIASYVNDVVELAPNEDAAKRILAGEMAGRLERVANPIDDYDFDQFWEDCDAIRITEVWFDGAVWFDAATGRPVRSND